jgi:hypothetical protein
MMIPDRVCGTCGAGYVGSIHVCDPQYLRKRAQQLLDQAALIERRNRTAEPQQVQLPKVNRGAMGTATLAYIEDDGIPVKRLETAIAAYLWSMDESDKSGLHPSYNDLRRAMGKEPIPVCPRCHERLPHYQRPQNQKPCTWMEGDEA